MCLHTYHLTALDTTQPKTPHPWHPTKMLTQTSNLSEKVSASTCVWGIMMEIVATNVIASWSTDRWPTYCNGATHAKKYELLQSAQFIQSNTLCSCWISAIENYVKACHESPEQTKKPREVRKCCVWRSNASNLSRKSRQSS